MLFIGLVDYGLRIPSTKNEKLEPAGHSDGQGLMIVSIESRPVI
jgi:hypothetical protein